MLKNKDRVVHITFSLTFELFHAPPSISRRYACKREPTNDSCIKTTKQQVFPEPYIFIETIFCFLEWDNLLDPLELCKKTKRISEP